MNRSHRAPMLRFVILSAAFLTTDILRAADLTGAMLFSTDSQGNLDARDGFNTLGGDGEYNLFVASGDSNGPLLNGPTDGQAAIDISLHTGVNTFTTFATYMIDGLNSATYGLNLFLNGNNSAPAISVFAPVDYTGAGSGPPISPDSGITFGLDVTPLPGSGTLTAGNITLTEFRLFDPNLTNLDRVGAFNVGPDGSHDAVAQVTLLVVPEPSAAVLAAIGLATILAARGRFRRR